MIRLQSVHPHRARLHPVMALVLAAQAVVFLWLIERREEPNYLELTSRLAAELSHALQSTPRST